VRAGKLDKSISIERLVETLDEYGVPREAWTPIATLKAQIVQASAEEFLRSGGIAAESTVIFRTRYIEGVTPAARIVFNGHEYDVKETREIGRRRGLEIHSTAKESGS
jgi:SPP1 family predicted phage head-tail adaptor